MKSREEQIAERLRNMPQSYRANYKKAVQGNSLRAAIKAFCQECVGWQIEGIRECTDLGCPLYAVRPYQNRSQSGRGEGSTSVNSTI
jgi:hypothetical protein